MQIVSEVVKNLNALTQGTRSYEVDDVTDDRTEDTKAKQILRSNDRNVAAVMYSKTTGFPHVAANTNGVGPVQAVFGDLYRPVVDTTDGKHAEMKILDYFFDNNLFKSMGYIGISKPCCLGCAAVLVIANHENPLIGFKGTHGKTYGTGWALPNYIASDETRLKAFLGETAWDLYTKLSEQGQKALLNTLNTRIGG